MEESLPDGENVISDSSEELDSDVGTQGITTLIVSARQEKVRMGRSSLKSSLRSSWKSQQKSSLKSPRKSPWKSLLRSSLKSPMGSSLGSPPQDPLRFQLRKPQWNTSLQSESHHLGASEKLKKEWLSMHQKKRLTACVEDPVGAETIIQEDYKADGCSCLWPHKTSTHG